MKQIPRESTNEHRVRMEDTIKFIVGLGLEICTQHRQSMRYLHSLDRLSHSIFAFIQYFNGVFELVSISSLPNLIEADEE